MIHKKLNLGLLGLGRLGRVYASHLAALGAGSCLAAVADTDAELARNISDELGIAKWYFNPLDLLADRTLDAVVIATPTGSHHDLVIAAAEAGKAIFCEKPLSIALAEALSMKKSVEKNGVFFQMGFMRRFDRGYLGALEKIQAGVIGEPVLFKSTSRDPFSPPITFADPLSSGGMIMDMGIHDLDLARWLLGAVRNVRAMGGALVYPELRSIGDIDTAVVTLHFQGGQLGVIDLSRHAVYGYDICSEILGTKGAIRIGYLRETPILVMTENRIAHDTVPHFPQRFHDAYLLQLKNFVDNLRHERRPPVTLDDGIEALRIALAATKALETGAAVDVI